MKQRINRELILATAVAWIEDSQEAGELSLRAVARRLGVKAPSLYRCFADKAVLERAVVEEIQRQLLEALRLSVARKRRRAALAALAVGYVEFGRQHAALYVFMMKRRPGVARIEATVSAASKLQWKLMLKTVGGLAGNAHDVASAVALWSLLHGMVALEAAGCLVGTDVAGGLEAGLEALSMADEREGAHRRRWGSWEPVVAPRT